MNIPKLPGTLEILVKYMSSRSFQPELIADQCYYLYPILIWNTPSGNAQLLQSIWDDHTEKMLNKQKKSNLITESRYSSSTMMQNKRLE